MKLASWKFLFQRKEFDTVIKIINVNLLKSSSNRTITSMQFLFSRLNWNRDWYNFPLNQKHASSPILKSSSIRTATSLIWFPLSRTIATAIFSSWLFVSFRYPIRSDIEFPTTSRAPTNGTLGWCYDEICSPLLRQHDLHFLLFASGIKSPEKFNGV